MTVDRGLGGVKQQFRPVRTQYELFDRGDGVFTSMADIQHRLQEFSSGGLVTFDCLSILTEQQVTLTVGKIGETLGGVGGIAGIDIFRNTLYIYFGLRGHDSSTDGEKSGNTGYRFG